ncbi:MAG TPA: 4'-phosphopantetheinyl transferase superfamily protein [Chlamydiales bacterium]|nr:4'-phosphopantetheinyl transferase superfamily protein [Chlamydiales bacterium]
MKKKILFFTQDPPADTHAIHVWLGASTGSHEEILYQILCRYLKAPFHLERTSKGKLYIPNSPLNFNLSDCQEHLAICFNWGSPVGIDIEIIRPIEEMKQIIQDHFSWKEQAYIYACKTKKIARFWEIWNRKEACLKALGIGLQDNMKEWDCSGKNWILVKRTYVRSIPVPYKLSAAVAIEMQGIRIQS